MSEAVNAAYRERNHLAAFVAAMAIRAGWRAGIGIDPAQENFWQKMLFIDTPAGQVSFHIGGNDHDLLELLPVYAGVYDGHSSEQKWKRIDDTMAAINLHIDPDVFKGVPPLSDPSEALGFLARVLASTTRADIDGNSMDHIIEAAAKRSLVLYKDGTNGEGGTESLVMMSPAVFITFKRLLSVIVRVDGEMHPDAD